MTKEKILVISGNPAIYDLIQRSIQKYSVDIFYTRDSIEKHSQIIKNGYCLTIIDIKDGVTSDLDFLRMIRNTSYTPILVLTDKLTPVKHVELLRVGADVYIEKPINLDICMAQINALTRLCRNARINDEGTLVPDNGFVINPCHRRVYIDGKPLALTRKEFDMLLFFARHPEQVFSVEQLYEYIWSNNFAFNGGETVRAHIKNLRKKLAKAGKACIYNVWGIGYKCTFSDDKADTVSTKE